jgi:hypothetical protein
MVGVDTNLLNTLNHAMPSEVGREPGGSDFIERRLEIICLAKGSSIVQFASV